MSLLQRSTEIVTVYPEIVSFDADGNMLTKPSVVGTVCRAVIQPIPTVENSESAQHGFDANERLRMRLVGWNGPELGAQSQVEWEGRRYSIYGEPKRYRGSSRTSHTDYHLIRN